MKHIKPLFILLTIVSICLCRQLFAHDLAGIVVLGDTQSVSRIMSIEMNDSMRFIPDDIKVPQNATIKFMIKNTGKTTHEIVLGTMASLKQHAEMMKAMPNMVHNDVNMLSLEPGQSGQLILRFTKAGTVNFACLMPGHFEAGMIGKINVIAPLVEQVSLSVLWMSLAFLGVSVIIAEIIFRLKKTTPDQL